VQLAHTMHAAVVLLIRGFGVRVPGGAPGGIHVSVGPIFTFASDILAWLWLRACRVYRVFLW